MTAELLKNVRAILELIEDKQYPAKRVLYDYITDLVHHFNSDVCIEMEKMGQEFFAKADKEAQK